MGDVTAVGMDTVTEKSGHQVTGMAVSVCITPAAPAPLPIPYPTMGTVAEGIVDEPMRTKINGAKHATVGSCVKVCHGNEPGALKEVVSLNTSGPSFLILGAPTVLCELGMMGITGSLVQMNKAITVGAPGSASGADGAAAGGGGGGGGGGSGGDAGNVSGPGGGGGSGGDQTHEGAAPPSAGAPAGTPGQADAGHPIDAITGTLFTTPVVDFMLPGFLAVAWVRSYRTSAVARHVGIGRGWSHSLAWYGMTQGGLFVLVDPDGRETTLPLPEPGTFALLPFGRRIVHDEDTVIIDLNDGLQRVLRREDGGSTWPLVQLRDAFGNVADVVWAGGEVVGIVDSVLRRVDRRRSGFVQSWVATVVDAGGVEHTRTLVTYELDARGDLVRVTDVAGVDTRFAYDDDHYLVTESRADGLVFRFVHADVRGERRCVETWGELPGRDVLAEVGYPGVDPTGKPRGVHHARFTFGPGPHESRLIDGAGQSHAYVGNAFGLVERYEDPRGYVSLYAYDPLGRQIATVDGQGGRSVRSFDAAGRLVSMTDPTGRTVRYDTSDDGATVTASAPGGTQVVEREDRGRVVERTSPGGQKTSVTYDERGLTTSIAWSNGGSDALEYDAHGNLARYTNAAGQVWRYTWDLFGLPVRITTPAGATYAFEYDARGNILRIVGPGDALTEAQYDALGRRVALRYPWGGTAVFRWVANCLVEQVHPDGRRWTTAFDALERMRSLTNPAGERWTIEYDASGNPSRQTTFAGLTHRFEYDGAGRVVSLLRPDESRIALRRDAAGRVLAREHSSGLVERLEYDENDRLLGVRGGLASVAFLYDLEGNLVRDTQTCGGWTFVVDYRYDKAGALVARKYSSGWSVEPERDAGGRVRSLVARTGDAAQVVAFEYDAGGSETARRDVQSGVSILTQRNVEGYPQRIDVSDGSGPARARTYTWDARGPLSKVVDSVRGARTFELDALGRPTRVVGLGVEESFAFAPQGTPIPAGAGGWVGPGGRPGAAGDATLRWDALGRLVARESADRLETWRYAYDDEDRLVEATRGDGLRLEYLYDPLGRRLAEICGGVSTWFGWDGDAIVEERVTSGRTTRRVFAEDRFTPLLESRDGASWGLVATDGAGTPWLYLEGAGRVREVDLTTWGKVAWERGDPGALRFAGQRADGITGLHYNRNRYYAPDLGVYTTPDPVFLLGGTFDIGFVLNPTFYVDPLGLLTIIAASNDPGLGGYYRAYASKYPGATILTPAQVTPGSLHGESDVVVDTHGIPGKVEWGGKLISGSDLANRLKGAGFHGTPGSRVEVVTCNGNTKPGIFGRSVSQAVADRTGATTSGAKATSRAAGRDGTSGLVSGMPVGAGTGNGVSGLAVSGGGTWSNDIKPRWYTFGH